MPCRRRFPGGSASLVDEPADDLSVTRMNGTSRDRTSSTARRPCRRAVIAETLVKKACIVNAEFADQRIERRPFRRRRRGHVHGFLRRENVELLRIEDQRARRGPQGSAPSSRQSQSRRGLDIDHTGVTLGAISDRRVPAPSPTRSTGKCDALVGYSHRAPKSGLDGHEAGADAFIGVELCTAPETHLRQARAGTHQHREGAGTYFGIEDPS